MNLKEGLIIFVLLSPIMISAQDMHFSQFNENPSLLNPALIGASGTVRASLNNKDQWRHISSPYKTFGASFETRLNPTSWDPVAKFKSMNFKEKIASRLAIGLSVYTDKAGTSNLVNTQGNLSLATFVPVSKKSFLSIGIQGNLSQRKIDRDKLIFPNQFNGSGYSQTINSNENFSNPNFTYGELSAGVLWSYAQEERKLNGNKQIQAKLGFACYHLTQPRQFYLSTGNRLYRRYVLHGDFLISLKNPDYALAPSFLSQLQGPSTEIVVGAMLKRFMNNSSKYTGIIKRNALGYGMYYRNKDALIFSLLFEWQEQIALGLSYDLNVSKLTKASSGRGGIEISIRYTAPKGFMYQKKKDTSPENKNK